MAKCFTVSYGVVTPGIGLAKDGTVHVGEEGRARRLVRVKPPEGAVFTADAFGQPVLAEVPGPGVILLIRDHAGFRGGWWFSEPLTARCPYDGQPIPSNGRCPGCGAPGGWFGAVSTQHRLPDNPLEADQVGKVIAHGHRAQGDAGRMGGGSEYVLRCQQGTRFSIRRSGRTYGNAHVFNVEITADGVVATDAEADIAEKAAAAAW